MEKINNEIKIEKQRKTAVALIFLVFAMVLSAFLVFVLVNGPIRLWIAMSILFLASFLLGTAMFIREQIDSNLAKILISKLETNVEGIEIALKKGIPEPIFKGSNFISNYNKYISACFISANIDDINFISSEISVKKETKTKEGKYNRETLFKGFFTIKDKDIPSTLNIVIFPDVNNKILNNLSEDVRKLFGDKEKSVKLENVEFERNFEVVSNDQVAARKIITLEFMEKLLEIKNKLNKNLTVIYKNKRIYIFVEGFYLIDSFKVFFYGCNKTLISETSNKFNLIGELTKLI